MEALVTKHSKRHELPRDFLPKNQEFLRKLFKNVIQYDAGYSTCLSGQIAPCNNLWLNILKILCDVEPKRQACFVDNNLCNQMVIYHGNPKKLNSCPPDGHSERELCQFGKEKEICDIPSIAKTSTKATTTIKKTSAVGSLTISSIKPDVASRRDFEFAKTTVHVDGVTSSLSVQISGKTMKSTTKSTNEGERSNDSGGKEGIPTWLIVIGSATGLFLLILLFVTAVLCQRKMRKNKALLALIDRNKRDNVRKGNVRQKEMSSGDRKGSNTFEEFTYTGDRGQKIPGIHSLSQIASKNVKEKKPHGRAAQKKNEADEKGILANLNEGSQHRTHTNGTKVAQKPKPQTRLFKASHRSKPSSHPKSSHLLKSARSIKYGKQ